MSAPKHLWSGDWQRDSEAAARERAQRRPPLSGPPEADEPEAIAARTEPSPGPPAPGRTPPGSQRQRGRPLADRRRAALAYLRAHPALDRARARLLAIATAVALLVVGGAYALNALVGDSGKPQPTAVNANAWLGLQMQSLANGTVVISSVVPGSPAASAGMKPGDVITEIESRPVGAPIDVTEAVAALNAGETVELRLVRGSTAYTARVKLTARPASFP